MTQPPLLPGLGNRPAGTRVSIRVAVDLCRLPEVRIQQWIASGRVRTERIRGVPYVDLADIDAAVAAEAR